MNELISIIIPVYNVECYLERCVLSVINQTYQNLEIILVDDESPDRCPQMCDEWAKKDKRIRVIHKKNGGLSSARNAGLDVMTGKYVYFIDSDDYIEKETIETLYRLLIQNDADMAFARYYRIFDKDVGFYQPPFSNTICIYSDDDFWHAYYNSEESESSVNMIVSWNKLVRAFAFSDVRFDVGKIHEDEFIIHRLVYKCKRIVFVDKKLYNYYQNPAGIMSSMNEYSIFCKIEGWSNRVLFFSKFNKEYTLNAYQYFFGFFKRNKNLLKNKARELSKTYRKTFRSAKRFLKKDSFKNRVLYHSFYIGEFAFKFTYKALNICHKIKELFK